MTENDFEVEVKAVDQDTAEQRVTEPATHDEELFQKQTDAETEAGADASCR